MRGSFTVQFFDLMVHVVPGAVVIAAAGFMFDPVAITTVFDQESEGIAQNHVKIYAKPSAWYSLLL